MTLKDMLWITAVYDSGLLNENEYIELFPKKDDRDFLMKYLKYYKFFNENKNLLDDYSITGKTLLKKLEELNL